MSKYLVIKSFSDMQDNNYKYHVGDYFPHDGLAVTPERIEELSTDKNRRKTPLIEEVKEEQPEVQAEETAPVKEETTEVEETKAKPRKRKTNAK